MEEGQRRVGAQWEVLSRVSYVLGERIGNYAHEMVAAGTSFGLACCSGGVDKDRKVLGCCFRRRSDYTRIGKILQVDICCACDSGDRVWER